MAIHLTDTTLTLQPGRPQLMKGVAGARIRVMSGCVWITQYGQSRDFVLGPGREIELDLPSPVVMSASTLACVRVELNGTPAAAPWWKRWLSWLDPRWSSAASHDLERHLPGGALH